MLISKNNQLYGDAKDGQKTVSVNINIGDIRSTRVLNWTGYAWVDQKMKFGKNLLEAIGGLTIVHDSDYLGAAYMIDYLKDNKHEVVFLMAPSDDYRKRDHELSNCPASNQRIREAFNRLKDAGVPVKKFRSLETLNRYLEKKQTKREALKTT